jgi:hypothetical protein
MSEELGTLTERLVHPTSPVLLTKNGPLGALAFNCRGSTKKPDDIITIESLRIG